MTAFGAIGVETFTISGALSTASTTALQMFGVSGELIGLYATIGTAPATTPVTVNISKTPSGGGATLYYPQALAIAATGVSGATYITLTGTITSPIRVGCQVSGTGIATGATVTAVNGAVITLSAANTGAVSGNATFNPPILIPAGALLGTVVTPAIIGVTAPGTVAQTSGAPFPGVNLGVGAGATAQNGYTVTSGPLAGSLAAPLGWQANFSPLTTFKATDQIAFTTPGVGTTTTGSNLTITATYQLTGSA